MPTFYVDDGGSGTDPYDTWAKAATSLKALDDAKVLAAGDIIYVGHNHVESTGTHSANWSMTLPASGVPARIISATQGSDPPTYAKSSTNQVDTSGGAYAITLDGCVALYGIRMQSGASPVLGAVDFDESLYCRDFTIAPQANGTVSLVANAGGAGHFDNLTVDLTADGTTNRSALVFAATTGYLLEIRGLTFTNAAYRTGSIFGASPSFVNVSGADFSGFTNATACEIVASLANGKFFFTNCLTASTWTPVTGQPQSGGIVQMTNCGPADAPTYLFHADYFGTCLSSAAIYRSGGATVEGDATAWLITTTANCAEGAPFRTPYMYAEVSSTGSKTFDLYITNDTGDFDNSQVWLEIEALGTADEANTTLFSDQRDNSTGAFISITEPVDTQAYDTASTWNGTGPSFTFKQKLSVTATVNEAGMYRARVCVGVASIASSRFFYIDPKVTVT